jgi:cathepsin L
MKSVIALLLGAASTSAWNKEYTLDEVHAMDTMATFKAWSSAFDREYTDLEEASSKFMTWLDNLYVIAESNSQELSYKLGLNQFSDLNTEEFRHYVHGDNGACFKGDERKRILNRNGRDHGILNRDTDEQPLMGHMGHGIQVPDSVDWSTKGVVTPVKNQGQCGSCWAFSATGAMECQYAIKTGTLNSLSEQELVDCAGFQYGCLGCNGGQMTGAMKYAAKEGGLCAESEYKYEAKDGTCKASSCGTKYDANQGYDAVTPEDSAALEAATAAGCVSIGIEADQTAFQHYSSGVLPGTCGTSIDHGVLVVGYGTDGANKYWKVKNSWGETWGQKGYVNICRDCGKNGKDGECGILMEPNVPTF